MARLKNGLYGPIVGRIGNTVGYIRLGKAIVRQISPTKKHRVKTEKQKAAFDRMRVIMEFLSPINRFVNISFKLVVKDTTWIPQNAAVSQNINTAIKGEYPNLELDYPKILVSKGDLLPAENAMVSHVIASFDNDHATTAIVSIKFQWDVDPGWDYPTKRAEVMMVAYLPDNKKAFFSITGARRSAGEDVLQGVISIKDFGNKVKDRFVETYIAFISDDRESISDSIYTGRIIL